jgi:hypothetical protein
MSWHTAFQASGLIPHPHQSGLPVPDDFTTPDIMTHTTQDELTAFSSMLATLVAVDDHYAITLPADWLQGRTAYGGLSASLCLQATLLAQPDLPPLRSAQFSFIGPASGALRIRPQLLRQGTSRAEERRVGKECY